MSDSERLSPAPPMELLFMAVSNQLIREFPVALMLASLKGLEIFPNYILGSEKQAPRLWD